MTEASKPLPPAIPAPAPSRRASPSGPRALSDGQKEALTIQALGLLNERVQARIARHRSQLQTSVELDPITARIAAELRVAPGAAGESLDSPKTSEEMEEEQTRVFSQLLPRFFAGGSRFAARVSKPLGKKIAKLFFESELSDKSRSPKDKLIVHPEQGLHHVLSRYKHRLRAELDGFQYQTPELRLATLELLTEYERDLELGCLARRSPELNRLLTIYAAVLGEFLHKQLPPRLEQMGKATVRVSKSARRPTSVGDKVQADAFGDFRAEWERLFMQQLVFFCGDQLLERLAGPGEGDESARELPLRFFTDPHLFSETGGVICEALYDFLCVEGFLDLPVDWRVSLGAQP